MAAQIAAATTSNQQPLTQKHIKRMKLDRNINRNGVGKYALILLRNTATVSEQESGHVEAAINTLNHAGCLDYGEARDNEFFVIRLKDQNAEAALRAYAKAAETHDPEWAHEVAALADKAANHPRKKRPD